MDFLSRRSLSLIQSGIQRRISALSGSFDSKLWRYRRWGASAGFLLAAIFLASWAHSSSQAEAVLNWERTHVPSEKLVQVALQSRGLRRMEEGKVLNKVLRELPVSLDEKSAIWMTSDSNWVAYYLDPDQATQAQVFCLECSTPPSPWQPVGLGWQGLEAALVGLDQRLASYRAPAKAKGERVRPKVWRDPRAVVY